MGITFNPFSATLDFTGSGGGGTIAGSIANTQVAFGTGVNTIGGHANLTWGTVLSIQNTLTVGVPVSSLNAAIQADLASGFVGPSYYATSIASQDQYSAVFVAQTSGFYNVAAAFVGYALTGAGSYPGAFEAYSKSFAAAGQTVDFLVPFYAAASNEGAGAVGSAYGIDTSMPNNTGGGTIDVGYGLHIHATTVATTANYAIWVADVAGVKRWAIDDTFDGVYQVIDALYNPQFAVYTPGATNFERVVLGQWESNVAVITTEKGGTGTLRPLQLGDASVPVQVGGSVFRPTTSDAAALGSATLQWSDLFLAEGGVINWDNGDATLTQVGDVVTLAGAALANSAPGTAANSVATIDGTQTLTNKRITKRVVTAADATSITPNTDSADVTYQANTQAAGTLTINADGGTPTNGQSWLLKIKSTNVQTFSWNAVYVGGTVPLPTTTTGSSTIDNFAFLYDTVNSKWQFTGAATGY